MMKRRASLVSVIWAVAVFFTADAYSTGNPPAKIIKIYATFGGGFAGLWDNGTVTAWGSSSHGGTLPAAVTTALTGQTVKEIYSNDCAFAALTTGGKVVTWGGDNCGGDSSAVSTKLSSGVTEIVPNRQEGLLYSVGAFAALKSDGSVVSWGSLKYGGDSSGVATELSSGVSSVVANVDNFAALKSDGSVVTWGRWGKPVARYVGRGGMYRGRDVSAFLQDGVTQIAASESDFIALKSDGYFVGWGEGFGSDTLDISYNIQYATSKVSKIFSTKNSFAALRDNGSVFSWGDMEKAGNNFAVRTQLASGVGQVFSNNDSFAALKTDGTVVTWGWGLQDGVAREYSYRHDGSNYVRTEHSRVSLNVTGKRVTKIFPSWHAFVALKDDGSIVVWGSRAHGADTSAATTALGSGQVNTIVSNMEAFAILKQDGSVGTWGSQYGGGDSSGVASDLAGGVIQVVGSQYGFCALKDDGTVVNW